MDPFRIAVVIFVIAFVALVFWQTKMKGRWGLGRLSGGACPRCGTQIGTFRKPKSMREIMWGGWTCPKCGTKLDKYGKEIAAE